MFDSWFEKIPSDTNLIVLPEMFSTGFTMCSEDVAETMKGSTIKWMLDRAQKLNAVITGSVVIKENDRFFNRLVWARPDGTLKFYDKRHCFRMAGEHEHYTAGSDRVVVELADFRACLMICYDLRFPVWFRNRNDYDLIVCVANWPAARQDSWNTLLRARAIENQCYVVGVNRVGTDDNNVVYSGGSAIYDFTGKTLAEVFDEEKLITSKLNKTELDLHRTKFPVWQDADAFELSN